jgi:hypothetical protein
MRRTTAGLLTIPLLLLASMSGCSDESDATSSGAETIASDPTDTATPADSVATTFPTSDTARIPVVAPEDVTGPLVMTPVGIGPFRLGDEAKAVIASMNEIFGKPTEDTGWDVSLSPCEGLGRRNRYVTWGRVSMTFAEGPTLLVTDKVEHLLSYLVFDDPDPKMPEDRFVLDDGQPALGRSENEMTSWNADVKFEASDIEGPVWFVSIGGEPMSGVFAPPDDGVGAARTRTVRAGLVCVD